jgi:hypothetical protein
MRSALLATAVLGMISTSALTSTAAFADETLKYPLVYHITDLHSQDVPDTNGHIVSLIRTSGLACA